MRTPPDAISPTFAKSESGRIVSHVDQRADGPRVRRDARVEGGIVDGGEYQRRALQQLGPVLRFEEANLAGAGQALEVRARPVRPTTSGPAPAFTSPRAFRSPTRPAPTTTHFEAFQIQSDRVAVGLVSQLWSLVSARWDIRGAVSLDSSTFAAMTDDGDKRSGSGYRGGRPLAPHRPLWIPAFAGMTND